MVPIPANWGSRHIVFFRIVIMSNLVKGEKIMFTHALHEIFGSKTMFVVGGGFVVWGAILVGMTFNTGASSIVNIAF